MTIGDPVLRMLAVCCLGKTYVPKDNLARVKHFVKLFTLNRLLVKIDI